MRFAYPGIAWIEVFVCVRFLLGACHSTTYLLMFMDYLASLPSPHLPSPPAASHHPTLSAYLSSPPTANHHLLNSYVFIG